MPVDAKQPISVFLDATAAKQPAPGGGAVTALVGATAAAIGEMVLHYSIGRKNSSAYDQELRQVLNELTRARAVMLELLVEDQLAFVELQATKKLSDGDPLKSTRHADAAAVCIRVPQAISTTALIVLELADRVVEKSNKWLLSDLAVCVELAMATLRSGVHNVRANLGEIPDLGRRSQLSLEGNELVARGVTVAQRIMPRIAALMNA